MLTAAADVDELIVRPDGRKPEPGMGAEIIEEFKDRVWLLVQLSLKNAPAATRDEYKNGPAYQARKGAIQAFLKAAVGCKKCNRCDW